MARLLDQLGYPADTADVAARLEYWSTDPHSRLIVADVEEELVGVAALHALPLLEHTGRRGRLVALVVDGAARGCGIGRVLVTAVEEAAQELGCRDLEITSSRERSAALGFYQTLGYVDQCGKAARFIKPLG